MKKTNIIKNDYDTNNVFYKIILGEISVNKLYEDDFLICIKDIAPVAPVHVLVIPKEKFRDFEDFIQNAPDSLISSYYKVIPKLAREQGADQYRVITNIGALSGQTVFHFHTHIIGGKNLGGLVGE